MRNLTAPSLRYRYGQSQSSSHEAGVIRKNMSEKKSYTIDGTRIATLEEFYEEISRVLVPGVFWGKNLDAFNDILRGGFGTPDEGFKIVWANYAQSKKLLGYEETVRVLRTRLKTCHPSNRECVEKQLLNAMKENGPTVYDWLVEIIEAHCIGGQEAEDGVELYFE